MMTDTNLPHADSCHVQIPVWRKYKTRGRTASVILRLLKENARRNILCAPCAPSYYLLCYQ